MTRTICWARSPSTTCSTTCCRTTGGWTCSELDAAAGSKDLEDPREQVHGLRGLYTPRTSRRYSPRLDPETVGQFTESIARFFGTGRYLLLQTIVVIVWIALNLFARGLRWDPYPFILLNLAFSTQAAYAAPLILLAQNRQENRDRVALEEDRRRAAQTKADTEYLARELAAAATGRRRGRDA